MKRGGRLVDGFRDTWYSDIHVDTAMLRASTRRRVQITSGTRNRVDTGLSPLPRHDQRAPVRIRIRVRVDFFHDAMATQREKREIFIHADSFEMSGGEKKESHVRWRRQVGR